MHLFLFNRQLARTPAPPVVEANLPVGAYDGVDHFATPDGLPFVLTHDGDVDEILSGFMRYLPTAGARARETWKTYAKETISFTLFLEQARGVTPKGATLTTFQQYRITRLEGPLSQRLTPRSWNKAASALIRFASYLDTYHGTTIGPIAYREYSAPVNHEDVVRMVSLEEYELFREYGMAPFADVMDGTPRHFVRNTAFAELLVTSGLRVEEAASLLYNELPRSTSTIFENRRIAQVPLAASVAKGKRGRNIVFSKRVAQRYIDAYIREERSHHVARFIARTFKDKHLSKEDISAFSDYLFYIPVGPGHICLIAPDGSQKSVRLDKLRIDERKRLIEITPEGQGYHVINVGPLWISERGTMVSKSTWQWLFGVASQRCSEAVGRTIMITPHVLRHTFSVYFLSHLLKVTIAAQSRIERDNATQEVYRKIIGDPLRQLQRLLGHRCLSSTYQYLTYIDDAVEEVEAAIMSWEAEVVSLSDPEAKHEDAIL